MHKVEDIKVGDRITWGGHSVSFEVKEVTENDVLFVAGGSKEYPDGWAWDSPLTGVARRELSNLLIINRAPQASPVKTVTRKEIVPGVYGRVDIDDVDEEGVYIRLPRNARWEADELRETATIFNELAGALEDGK